LIAVRLAPSNGAIIAGDLDAIVPSPLRPGDPIAVIAPSSPFDRALAMRGLGWMRERYRVSFDASLFARNGYLAGNDERRLREIDRAFASDARAVVAMRGGYGLARIAHLLDWSAILAHPRWIVGFSDVTTLHAEAWRRGLASVHGPMVTSLGRGDQHARERWISVLERPATTRSWSGLSAIGHGTAEGPLVGGNLASLHACAASGRLIVPEGSVVLLEDVGERPYRVDRMLTGLIVGGHLAKASGFLVGEFESCHPGADGVTIEQVLRERLETLAVPTLFGFPVGHGRLNEPVVLCGRTRVDADSGSCSIGAPSR
jgi:muramoyltetrapeptide carboxypeptidase